MSASSNNSLTTSMKTLSLPASTISKIVDDPSSITDPSSVGISASSAAYILNHGFTRGFRLVFILNAALTAAATVASVLMIKHKELTRGDEETLRKAGKQEKGTGKSSDGHDVEMDTRSPPGLEAPK
ncbi:hypothetical protein C0993_008318 [Termitomyces sp. T159_Od127]|nr:hypothetical protein C0993_008318 [Termitomyces sp. T159_Od127]